MLQLLKSMNIGNSVLIDSEDVLFPRKSHTISSSLVLLWSLDMSSGHASTYSAFVVGSFSAGVVVAAAPSRFLAHFASFHILSGLFIALSTCSR
jgi:hypothetical protein